ncbi:MAG: hypothetical protein IIB61_03115 [Planctomycetes bacterium]|nr:hypothetical protein [Planctomycetota bacterium]
MATTIYVDDDCSLRQNGSQSNPFCTIQEGIDAASNGDTVLVAAGTYTGSGNKNLTWTGMDITIEGAGTGYTTIDLEGSGRAFYLHHPSVTRRSIIKDLRITDGYVDAVGVLGNGGAILLDGATGLLLEQLRIDSCEANNGGGIFVNDGSVLGMCDVAMALNVADIDGGAIRVTNATALILDCTVSNNSTTNGSGGGISFFADASSHRLDLKDTVVSKNTAGGHGGGGIAFAAEVGVFPTLDMDRCTIDSNTVSNDGFAGGGGVLVSYPCSESAGPGAPPVVSPVSISNSFITRNTAVVAGGANILAKGGGLWFDGCAGDDTITICNCTIAENTAGGGTDGEDWGGGIYTQNVDNLDLDDTIFWNNSADDEGDEIAMSGGTLLSDFLDVDGTGTGCVADEETDEFVYLFAGADETCGTGNIDADPVFVNVAGGDFHLDTGSLVENEGSTNGCKLYDVDGEDRTVGVAVDIGADEIQLP